MNNTAKNSGLDLKACARYSYKQASVRRGEGGSVWGGGLRGEVGEGGLAVVRAYQTLSPVILSTTVKAVPVLLAELSLEGVDEGEESATEYKSISTGYDIIFVMQ